MSDDPAPIKPKPYQAAGAEFLAAHERAVLADAPGLGKTLQTLLALDLAGIGPLDNVLVVAPLSVLPGWQKDAIKWTEWRRFSIYRRKDALPKNPGHALVPWTDLVVMRDKLLTIPWRVIVVDEAHRLKQMASDGQPGWGEVIRDIIGPPAPLDTLYPPIRLFAHTNTPPTTCAKGNPVNPTKTPSTPNVPTLSDAWRAVAAAIVTLADRLDGDFSYSVRPEDATVSLVVAPATETKTASTQTTVKTKPEAKVEVKAEPKIETKVEAQPAESAPAPAAAIVTASPMTNEQFLPLQVQYLGDRITDPKGYDERRDKIVAGKAAVSGVPNSKIKELTDQQRGELAVRLGIVK
jgi:hypothetical protein